MFKIYLEERNGLLYPQGTAGLKNIEMFKHLIPKGSAPIEDLSIIELLADAHCWEVVVAKGKKGGIK